MNTVKRRVKMLRIVKQALNIFIKYTFLDVLRNLKSAPFSTFQFAQNAEFK